MLSEIDMANKTITLVLAIGMACVLAGCPGGSPAGDGAGSKATGKAAQATYPVPRPERKYQQVHKSIADAWFLVETGYTVIKDKYTQANQLLASPVEADRVKGAQLKAAVTDEIQENIFIINPKIEQLFKDAITAEPDNPLNYAAYAYYLKARKVYDSEGKYVGEGEEEARKNIDKAIELWPDESSFYLLKIHILSAPHQCHEWFRGAAGEDIVLASRLEELRGLFQQAEQYDPQNAYINYYHALLFTSLLPPQEFSTIQDEVLRELKSGNAKPDGRFFYPPPLEPYYSVSSPVKLRGNEDHALYYDQWNFFGVISESVVRTMIDGLMADTTWPDDKATYRELMLALYRFGRIQPLTRSFFSLQSGIITKLQQDAEPSSQEARDLAVAARFLNQQYVDLANEMFKKKVISDAKQMDVLGVAMAESRVFRLQPEVEQVQKREAAYLKHAGEVLGMDFDLPSEPAKW